MVSPTGSGRAATSFRLNTMSEILESLSLSLLRISAGTFPSESRTSSAFASNITERLASRASAMAFNAEFLTPVSRAAISRAAAFASLISDTVSVMTAQSTFII